MMGMDASIHVSAIRDADDRHRRMMTAWQACKDAGVPPPKEVTGYFNGEPPKPEGLEIGLAGMDTMRGFGEVYGTPHECVVRSFKDDDGYRAGFIIDLSKLPKQCTMLCVSATVSV
jgi:hypothetical protein